MESDVPTSPSVLVTGGFRPRRLTHVNLFVSDVRRSTEFYRDVAGLHLVFEQAQVGSEASFLTNGNSHHDIALIQIDVAARGASDPLLARRSRPGLNHLGFEMESELELGTRYREALGEGTEFYWTADHEMSRGVYLFDPEGNAVEFYADTDVDWRAVLQRAEGTVIIQPWDPLGGTPSPEHLYPRDPQIEVVPSATLPSRRISGVCIAAADLSAMTDFYTHVAGLSVALDGTNDGFVLLAGSANPAQIALVQADGSAPPGLHHVSLELETRSSLDGARQMLDARGIGVVAEVGAGSRDLIAVEDPDGLVCSFFYDAEPAGIRIPTRPDDLHGRLLLV